MLMQNFYKVTQSNHERIPSFGMRLEGTLNQIRLQYPGRIWMERYNSISSIIFFMG